MLNYLFSVIFLYFYFAHLFIIFITYDLLTTVPFAAKPPSLYGHWHCKRSGAVSKL